MAKKKTTGKKTNITKTGSKGKTAKKK